MSIAIEPEARFRPIARAVLGHYDVECAALVFLGASGNVTFRVETSDRARKYLLRLHRQPAGAVGPPLAVTHIRSELQWLEALDRDTELVVQTPVRTRAREYVTTVALGSQELHCSMLRWIAGRVCPDPPDPERAQRVGRLMATLHEHGSRWVAPADFELPVHDSGQLRRSVTRLRAAAGHGTIAATDFDVLAAAADRSIAHTEELERGPAAWGLVHADLHESNYVVHRGEPRAIDFGLCGLGFYLYDTAESVLHVPPASRRAFFDGYHSARPLQSDFAPVVESFFVSATIQGVAFHAAMFPETRAAADYASVIASNHLPKYLDGQPFLFTT